MGDKVATLCMELHADMFHGALVVGPSLETMDEDEVRNLIGTITIALTITLTITVIITITIAITITISLTFILTFILTVILNLVLP